MKVGDTAYLATLWHNDSPSVAQATCLCRDEDQRLGRQSLQIHEWIIGGGVCEEYWYYPGPALLLCPTLPAALAWLIERTAARLAEQEREAAQTRAALERLRGMMEEEARE